MCWATVLPVLAGTAISAIGSGLKTRQATKQAEAQSNARNQVLSNTMALNRPIAENSRAMFDARIGAGAPTPAAEAAAGQFRTGLLNGAADMPGDLPVSDRAPGNVRSAIGDAMLRAVQTGRERAQALAKLGTYGDLWFNQGVADNGLARNLSLNSNLAGGNLALIPSLQDLAEVGATKPLSPMGDIFIGVGNALGSLGGSGAFNRTA